MQNRAQAHASTILASDTRFAWGIICTLTGFAQNFGGFLTARLLLSLAESGFFPRSRVLLEHVVQAERTDVSCCFDNLYLQSRLCVVCKSLPCSSSDRTLTTLQASALAKNEGDPGSKRLEVDLH